MLCCALACDASAKLNALRRFWLSPISLIWWAMLARMCTFFTSLLSSAQVLAESLFPRCSPVSASAFACASSSFFCSESLATAAVSAVEGVGRFLWASASIVSRRSSFLMSSITLVRVFREREPFRERGFSRVEHLSAVCRSDPFRFGFAPTACESEPITSPALSTSTARSISSSPLRTKMRRSACSSCRQATACPARRISVRQFAMPAISWWVMRPSVSASSMRGHCLRKATRCSTKSLWSSPAYSS
mmetsp:Transcript_136012/g.290767  ORF Transcript_136012/g.290767 Transcript_136012/m.290767 type:complete len:248 (+) Transcript_136012:1346-2089(+)